MPSFGDEVARLMEDRKLTQQQLAAAIGVHQTFVSKIIRGDRDRLGADVLFKLAKVLGVECTHFAPFFAGKDEQPEPEPPAKPKRGKKK